jgi:hypothetical protein
MTKLNVSAKYMNEAKRKLAKLIKEILENHPRSKSTYLGKKTLTKQTGRLFNRIAPRLKKTGGKFVFEVSMMEYYKYLDDGTEHIQPWFFSEEIIDSKEIAEITEDLIESTIEQTLFNMVSKFNKK